MPGKESLQAVMHPVVNGSLYFVARGDGSHEFSATLEEHNKAVTRYQLKGKTPPAPGSGARNTVSPASTSRK